MMTKREMCGDMVSALGFGCMRFPVKDGAIDRELAYQMLETAYARGVNYYDTAYMYHDGESEKFLGTFLERHPRDSYFVATKMPMFDLKTIEQAKQIFKNQLDNLKVDYFDFYLVHAMCKERFELAKELGLFELLEKYKRMGKIRHLGFSFHDSYEVFESIVKYRDWDFCQIQINYMDTYVQAGMRGVRLCEERGIPMIAMEPVRGGSLAGFGEGIKSIFREYDDRSPAAWALGFVGSITQIKTVLSGMSDMAQVEDNLNTFDDFVPFNDAEQEIISRVADRIRNSRFNQCTKCRYCMPCPAGVDIPACFSIMNEYAMYDNETRARRRYRDLFGKAELCVWCGKCETLCPQHIAIRDDLNKIRESMK